jgi:LPXTG-motif cell wall-anchored protein
MVFDTSSLVPKLNGIAGTGISVVWYVVLGFVILIMLAIIISLFVFKKKNNLDVEFKLTRNDGRITNAEWGKGNYDAKKGVVYVRRPNMGRFAKGIPIRIFDIRRYLQGDKILTVIQVGPEDYRPVLNDSWTEHVETYKDDKTGEIIEVKESILNIKVDSGLNKAWKAAWDSAAKNAYSIRSLLQQFQTPIAIGIVIICCFVGFAVLWTKIPGK